MKLLLILRVVSHATSGFGDLGQSAKLTAPPPLVRGTRLDHLFESASHYACNVTPGYAVPGLEFPIVPSHIRWTRLRGAGRPSLEERPSPFEPSLDALSVRSHVISSLKILSHSTSGGPGFGRRGGRAALQGRARATPRHVSGCVHTYTHTHTLTHSHTHTNSHTQTHTHKQTHTHTHTRLREAGRPSRFAGSRSRNAAPQVALSPSLSLTHTHTNTPWGGGGERECVREKEREIE